MLDPLRKPSRTASGGRYTCLMRPGRLIVAASLLLVATSGVVIAQRPDAFGASKDHPAIQYSRTQADDPIAQLNRKLDAGEATLGTNGRSSYLTSVLAALQVPVESQMLVFSQTSVQGDDINYLNPRALFFNDSVAIGWVRGTTVLEAMALDPRQGAVFYTLDQRKGPEARFTRDDSCLSCHLTWDTFAVPGLLTTSMYPLPDSPNAYANGFVTDHRSPFDQRWGGWYVTGNHGGARHIGNVPVMPVDKGKGRITPGNRIVDSLTGLLDLDGFLTPYSDVVSLLVFNHQTHMTNLITRLGWEARVAERDGTADPSRVARAAADLVDYMLFVDEAALLGPVKGTSGYAERFAALGPADSKGRSLRQFDLTRRTFKYPCSYMIYSPSFEALPASAKAAAYDRLWAVLSGQVTGQKYRRLTAADRQAVIEILRETKRDLPAAFRS